MECSAAQAGCLRNKARRVPAGLRIRASRPPPRKKLRSRQSVPPSNAADRIAACVALGNDRSPVFHAPGPPTPRTREHFNPPSRHPTRLGHMKITCIRHMSKLPRSLLQGSDSLPSRHALIGGAKTSLTSELGPSHVKWAEIVQVGL